MNDTASASLSASTDNTSARPRGALHVTLWIAQVMLAVAFGMAGMMKITKPIAELVQTMAFAGVMPPALVRFIGTAELAGAIGVLLPALARVKPGLTSLAAAGLGIVMVMAGVFNISRSELQALPVNLALGALAGFVAWGRFRKAPIPPRS